MLASESSPRSILLPYLQMMRPANIVTAWADILVGCAIVGFISISGLSWSSAQFAPLLWLLLATTGLYGGGVVLNDVFDAELDRVERPERPIPSGRASINSGILLGASLLLLGVFAATQVSLISTQIACGVAITALVYDAIGKHRPVFGPLNMGLCRGGNWLLGMSLVPEILATHWALAIFPIVYIAAITIMSRGEVEGGSRSTSLTAVAMIVGLAIAMVGLKQLPGYSLVGFAPAGLVWLMLVLPAFVRACQTPSPEVIRLAVRSGVIGLIALDSAIAAGFSGWGYGAGVLGLLPLSRLLADRFAVT
jgi:4-hydroxybenzoate polyprenyltransferase